MLFINYHKCKIRSFYIKQRVRSNYQFYRAVSCTDNYLNRSSTVLLKTSSPVKIQSYKNANVEFYLLNNTKREYASHGLLVGITPGNTSVHTWEFNIPVNTKDTLSRTVVSLGNLANIFSDQAVDADGLDFYVLLSSADMPSSYDLALSALTFYESPAESEITFDSFPFKSQGSGTKSYPRLLAYRFRAYESVYNAYYRDWETDRKSTRLNSSHRSLSRMPSSA